MTDLHETNPEGELIDLDDLDLDEDDLLDVNPEGEMIDLDELELIGDPKCEQCGTQLELGDGKFICPNCP